MKKVFSSNLFFFILIILQLVSFIIVSPIIKITHAPEYLSLPLVEVLLIFLPSIIYIIVKRKSFKETLRLKPIGFTSVLIVILIGILIYPVAMLIGGLSQILFHNFLADAAQSMTSAPLWIDLTVFALAPAVCEETAMRGVVFSGYKEVDIRKAALMNGFLFGILHMNLQQFFYAFIIGVILAYIVYITDSIFSSMLCHFACNGTSFTLVYLVQHGTFKSSAAAASNQLTMPMILSLLITSIICMVIIILLLKALKGLNANKSRISEAIYHDLGEGKLISLHNEERLFNWPVYASFIIFIGISILMTVSMVKK